MIRFLSSLRLAIILLILIIILSIIGTLLPQGETPGFYQNYFPHWSGVISGLQFDHLYRSPLFLSLAFLFLLNIIFCSIKQLPLKFKQLKGQIEFLPAGGQPVNHKKLAAGFSDWLWLLPNSLAEELRKRHYQVNIKESGGRKTLVAQKGWPGLFGPEFVHAGLIIIIIGGLISAFFSQRIPLALTEGQTVDLPGKSFSVRLDRFTTDHYPDGSVKNWKSLISIIDRGQVKEQKTIEVNRPFKYDGLNFFQMSYGFDWDRTKVELEIKDRSGMVRNLGVTVGERVQIEPEINLRLLNFIPDFGLDEKGQPVGRSAEANNPAALIQISRNGMPVYLGWIFYDHPDQARAYRQSDLNLEMSLKKFEAPLFSGLEAASDPGMNPVWLGSAVLFLGLLASFYFNFCQLAVRVEPSERPLFLASSRHHQTGFYQELERLLESRPAIAKNSARKKGRETPDE
ncbi:MAG: cytochrome c biogenesis protein ResB [Acidobacteriota bacterium]|nr:cytochrome c biogenesis protein ResB [Acidobacteriota bacterium]